MKHNSLRQSSYAVLAALIWGTAFVAQSMAAGAVPSFAFNASRAVIAFAFLLVLCVVLQAVRRRQGKPVSTTRSKKDLLLGGLCCGVAMGLATYLQQKGLETTTSGKASFITTLYIVLIPIAGLFMKKRVPRTIWLSVALAVVGLYCLCVTESFTISSGDLCVLLCAFVFTGQILFVDHFAKYVDGVELSCAQFFFMTIFSLAGTLLFETPTCVAYTLQIMAQKDSDPAVISLLLSLESVFAAISGAVILGDRLSGREYFGCAVMLAAVVLAQLPEKKKAAV